MSLLLTRGDRKYIPRCREKCLVSGCHSYAVGVGLCMNHYQQWRASAAESCPFCGGRYECSHRSPDLFARSK